MTTKHEIKSCERCNALFECKIGDIANCQCSELSLNEATQQFLAQSNFDCLCKNCLAALNKKLTALSTHTFPDYHELKQDFHYYIENGLWVFTENYHLLRGYCCLNGCRHCPYGFQKD